MLARDGSGRATTSPYSRNTGLGVASGCGCRMQAVCRTTCGGEKAPQNKRFKLTRLGWTWSEAGSAAYSRGHTVIVGDGSRVLASQLKRGVRQTWVAASAVSVTLPKLPHEMAPEGRPSS